MKAAVTGLRAWLVQRLSAVYMIAFFFFLLWHFAADAPQSYESWRSWMVRPEIRIATFVFFTALLLHAWVGIRDVAMDYLHPLTARMFVLALAGFGLLASEAWVIRILLGS